MMRMIIPNTQTFHTASHSLWSGSSLSSGQGGGAAADDLIAQSRSAFRFVFSRIFGRVN